MIIYTSSQGEIPKERKKSMTERKKKILKKIEKTFTKVLTRERVCDILFELSSRER